MNTRSFSRVSIDRFLSIADSGNALIRARPWEVIRMRDASFPVEVVRGVPVVGAPEEIDITNAKGLREALYQATGDGSGTFVVDLTRTRFCDSAAIHALVDAHKRARAAGGRVLLAFSGTAVPRIFEITGVDRVIPGFPSVADALAHIPVIEAPRPCP
jgi:anti-sigma B factor antagonist